MKNNKRIVSAISALVLVIVGAFAVPAMATDDQPGGEQCVPSEAWDEEVLVTEAYDETVVVTEAWDETIVVEAAHWQHYSYNGRWDSNTQAPPFPSHKWQANTKSDPHGVGVEGAYFRSNGNHGKGDWFYLDWIEETTRVVHHDAVTKVVHHDAVYETVHHDAVTCPGETPTKDPLIVVEDYMTPPSCEVPTVLVGSVTTTTTYTWNDETESFDESSSVEDTRVETSLTDEELAACQPVEPTINPIAEVAPFCDGVPVTTDITQWLVFITNDSTVEGGFEIVVNDEVVWTGMLQPGEYYYHTIDLGFAEVNHLAVSGFDTVLFSDYIQGTCRPGETPEVPETPIVVPPVTNVSTPTQPAIPNLGVQVVPVQLQVELG